MKLITSFFTALLLVSMTANAEGFLGSTLIKTEYGYKKIEDLAIGEEVLSFHEQTKPCQAGSCSDKVNLAPKKITGKIPVLSNNAVTLSFDKESITVDGDSKIFSILDKKWILASEAYTGLALVTSDLQFVTVNKVEVSKDPTLFWTIEVEDNHTLFVSGKSVWIHNGPIAAVICGIVCKLIGSCGCAAGALVLLPLGPVVSTMYAAVCSALDGGATGSCVGVCLALPTP